MLRLLRKAALILALAWAFATPALAQSTGPVVLAAASLQESLNAAADGWARKGHPRPVISFAASSALARQIAAGAPADLFISADEDWMNYLADRRLVQPASRVNLLGNTLVLVAPASHPVALHIAPGFGLARALGAGRLAIADPAAVPAGKYARAALTTLGVWDAVASKVAPAQDVRAALLLVSRGEAPLGVVYRTDAIADTRVVVVDTFPADTHPPIRYPAVLTTTAVPEASRVLAALSGPAARTVFVRMGFDVDVK
jgi:molybdate transport system substrate-binding protein